MSAKQAAPQPSKKRAASRPAERELVFLFDVDNTLFDNDRMSSDLFNHIGRSFGAAARKRYLEIYEELRKELGYADYLGALERYRLEKMHDPRFLSVSNWLIEYPFPRRVFPGALEVIDQCRRWGKAAILSDGDAVFQPRKVGQSGLWQAFGGNVLIFIHKERELDWVEKFYPAKHYVMVDDKLRLLQAIKEIWKDRVTTVFVQQGHYAHDKAANAQYAPANVSVRRIADLLVLKKTDFLAKQQAASQSA
ncbi:MAG TPA: HAD family hydrolase [Bryocella sp.]|nr:HAD family hydrolase [Bryocella sp.]